MKAFEREHVGEFGEQGRDASVPRAEIEEQRSQR